MTYGDARRELERTSEFKFERGGVLVRDVALLAAVEAVRREDRVAAMTLVERHLAVTPPARQAA